ncbi:hypothetical protein FACS1894137_03880 [Spirochaetia bacterium]|nr:hypothetical protein FACS1894137_03880 [Spirochaetia bacterium]
MSQNIAPLSQNYAPPGQKSAPLTQQCGGRRPAGGAGSGCIRGAKGHFFLKEAPDIRIIVVVGQKTPEAKAYCLNAVYTE